MTRDWLLRVGEKCQTVCKPGSVPAAANAGGRWPFIWDARYRTPRATDPDDNAETRLRGRSPDIAPTWSCSRWGLPCRSCCH